MHESIYDAFREELVKNIDTFKAGDPLDPSTTLGPLARKDLQEGLKS